MSSSGYAGSQGGLELTFPVTDARGDKAYVEAMVAVDPAGNPVGGAAGSTPLTGSVSDTSVHMFGPFTPQLARAIWLTLVGTGAAGTAQLLRSTDGGTTKPGLTAGGVAWASYTFPATTGAIVNEQVVVESDAAATYYLSVTLTAGSLTYRIAQ